MLKSKDGNFSSHRRPSVGDSTVRYMASTAQHSTSHDVWLSIGCRFRSCLDVIQ